MDKVFIEFIVISIIKLKFLNVIFFFGIFIGLILLGFLKILWRLFKFFRIIKYFILKKKI